MKDPRRPRVVPALLLGALPALLFAAPAAAQKDPRFEYGKVEEVKNVEWKAQVKGGVVLTMGNSQTKAVTLGASVSRKEGNNRLTLEAVGAYGESNVLTPTVMTDPMTNTSTITGLTRNSVVSTNNWLGKGRYDRFFTANNSGYVSGQAAADKIAGKSFFGGGQVGYSRQLVKTPAHLAVAEIGYDFSHESYVPQPMKTLDPVTIHSARVFLGEMAKLSDATGATMSVEALFNLNTETKALNASTGQVGVGAFKDTRLAGKVGLTTTLVSKLSVGFGVTVKYDQNPAALPIPPGTAAGLAYAPGYQPFAQKLDTLTELNLIYTLL